MKLDKSYKPAVDGYKIYATLGNYRAIPSILFGVQKYLLDKCTVIRNQRMLKVVPSKS